MQDDTEVDELARRRHNKLWTCRLCGKLSSEHFRHVNVGEDEYYPEQISDHAPALPPECD